MEIKVNAIVEETLNEPYSFSASRMELGDGAGQEIWDNALSFDSFTLTPEEDETWKDHLPKYGAWDKKEIEEMGEAGRNALFIQFVSGDFRTLQGLCEEEGFNIHTLTGDQFAKVTENEGGNLYPVADGWFYYVGF